MGKMRIVLMCLLVALSVLASGCSVPKQDPKADRNSDTGIRHDYDAGSGLTVSGTDQCTHYSANASDVQHQVNFTLKNEGEKTVSWDRMFVVFDCGIVDEDYVIIMGDKLSGSLAPGETGTFEYFSGSDTAKLIKASASGKLGLRVSLYKGADDDGLDEIFHRSAILPRITPFKGMSEELVSPQEVSLSFTDDREAVTHQILKDPSEDRGNDTNQDVGQSDNRAAQPKSTDDVDINIDMLAGRTLGVTATVENIGTVAKPDMQVVLKVTNHGSEDANMAGAIIIFGHEFYGKTSSPNEILKRGGDFKTLAPDQSVEYIISSGDEIGALADDSSKTVPYTLSVLEFRTDRKEVDMVYMGYGNISTAINPGQPVELNFEQVYF